MRIGLFAKTFAGSDPAVVLRQCAEAGFEGVQYNMACSGLPSMPDDIPVAAACAVFTAARSTGQEVFAVSGTYNMIHPDPSVRRAGERRLAVIAASCREMGTPLITLCTGTRDAEDQWRHHPDNASRDSWRDLLTSFETAVAIAEAHDVMLGVEPELANAVNSATAARRLMSEIRSPRIGIVLDPANLFEQAPAEERRNIIAKAVELLSGHIVMAHAKDRAPDGSATTAGKGVIDFGHFLQVLQTAGFDGPLVAHGFAAEEAPGVASFLRCQRQAMIT